MLKKLTSPNRYQSILKIILHIEETKKRLSFIHFFLNKIHYAQTKQTTLFLYDMKRRIPQEASFFLLSYSICLLKILFSQNHGYTFHSAFDSSYSNLDDTLLQDRKDVLVQLS